MCRFFVLASNVFDSEPIRTFSDLLGKVRVGTDWPV